MLFPLFAVHGSKGSVRCNPNRESLYGLLLLVRVVRVVRGSWNLKQSVPCSSDTVQGREGRKETGVSAIFPCSRRSRVSRFIELGVGGGVSPGDGGCVSRLPESGRWRR